MNNRFPARRIINVWFAIIKRGKIKKWLVDRAGGWCWWLVLVVGVDEIKFIT
ncbi:MAG: hypothetical protein FWC61_04955 [Proteobacteria bacterium]|nr:hypothetical protein [Pseudomonadota bacterium]